jgi:Protein of unknown function (DUF3309)
VISFLFFLLIVSVIGTMPLWPYSRKWGYSPSGLVALALSPDPAGDQRKALACWEHTETTWPDNRQETI